MYCYFDPIFCPSCRSLLNSTFNIKFLYPFVILNFFTSLSSIFVTTTHSISISTSFLVNFHSFSCLLSGTHLLCLIHFQNSFALSLVSVFACPSYFHSFDKSLLICRVLHSAGVFLKVNESLSLPRARH